MEKKDTFDTMSIRRRLEKLKVESGMDALEFCKIYAPEKCEKSEAYARNYISQVFSGGTSFNNKQVSIDVEHLLNIVNSDRFPGVTLNYLVCGDETPAKVYKAIDFDLKNWTHADLCEFLWTLKTRYPDYITIRESLETPADDMTPDELQGISLGELPQKRSISIDIEEINEMASPETRTFSIGQALAWFHHDIKDSENNRDPEIREFALKKAINKMRDANRFDNPFLKDISNCDKETPFIIFYGE